MSSTSVTIGRRFRGPLESANGGYAAGVLAGALGVAGGVEVTLRLPPPLERPLTLRREGEAVLMLDGAALVAEARAGDPGVTPPAPPSWDDAAAAGSKAEASPVPEFAECFVCGRRPERDGLELYAGRLAAGDPAVAATWIAREVSPELIWAVIDCPGAYSLHGEGRGASLLARMTARVDRLPTEGERCIVMGWPLDFDGRKRNAGTALYGADGSVLAVSRQLWIEPRAVATARGQ